MTHAADAEAQAGVVFDALADPTRRSVLRDVAEHGPVTATQVAARLPVTRQAVAKHLAVLQRAGLVAVEEAGRERRFSVTTAPMADAGRWLTATGAAWDGRLDRLVERAAQRARDGATAHRGE